MPEKNPWKKSSSKDKNKKVLPYKEESARRTLRNLKANGTIPDRCDWQKNSFLRETSPDQAVLNELRNSEPQKD